MKKLVLLLAFVFFFFPQQASAVENPLDVPNNKVGIHILFPDEIEEAARLINSNGGDWGYVTVPIQAGDKDLVKWQKFMDQAAALHIIPIVRLLTEGDYFNTKVWRTPNESDIVDFGNFLNSLDWPTKNRYVIIFNEVNRGDEWGGAADAGAYARLLSYSVSVFKSKNDNFFIISAGLDNAAPNNGTAYINQYDYIAKMQREVPGIFDQVDGISSHSYPNPGFSKPPSYHAANSIISFQFEQKLIEQYTNKKLPIFITETGWNRNFVSEATVALYLYQAFTNEWNNDSVVAVTPFLLRASGEPFGGFSFLQPDGKPFKQYSTLLELSKEKGKPVIAENVLSKKTALSNTSLPEKDFSSIQEHTFEATTISVPQQTKDVVKWLLKM